MAPIDLMTAWREQILELPDRSELTIQVERNDAREHLSCLLCHCGQDERYDPPEHVVSFRTSRESVCAGLHENCRKRNARAGLDGGKGTAPKCPNMGCELGGDSVTCQRGG